MRRMTKKSNRYQSVPTNWFFFRSFSILLTFLFFRTTELCAIAYPSTPHIASFKSFGARCCSRSHTWSKALTGVSFTRAYDDEGGTEDTTARSHRQHYQLLPRAQWEGEDRGMGTSDEGAGESQNQDVFEWCEEDRCRLYETKEGWRSRDQDFIISETQRGVYIASARHREEDDGNPGHALCSWPL